jgi:hypothetical protein
MFDEGYVLVLVGFVLLVSSRRFALTPEGGSNPRLLSAFVISIHETVDRDHVADRGGRPDFLRDSLDVHHGVAVRDVVVDEIIDFLVQVFCPTGAARGGRAQACRRRIGS